MKKVGIIYWSGTGNTEAMAKAIAEGAKVAGAEVDLMTSADFSSAKVDNYDTFAFGCPSMGDEVLEEIEFEPMFTECENSLSGKQVALFGSYGWGDGQWMREWVGRCEDDNMQLIEDEGLIVNETPNDDDLELCRALGKKLA